MANLTVTYQTCSPFRPLWVGQNSESVGRESGGLGRVFDRPGDDGERQALGGVEMWRRYCGQKMVAVPNGIKLSDKPSSEQ